MANAVFVSGEQLVNLDDIHGVLVLGSKDNNPNSIHQIYFLPLSMTLPEIIKEKNKYKLFLNFHKAYTPVKNPVELSELCEKFVLGHTPSKKDSSMYGGKYLWATIADMTKQGKYITDTVLKLSEDGFLKMGKNRFIKKGGLLMSFKLTLGKTSFAGNDLFTNEAICELVFKDEYNTEEVKEYLYHIMPLVNYMPFAQRAAKGLTLNKELLPTVEIPFPKKDERIAIVKQKNHFIKEKAEIEQKQKNYIEEYDKFIKTKILGQTPMDKLTAGYEKLMKDKEQNQEGKTDFDKAISKAAKQRGAK